MKSVHFLEIFFSMTIKKEGRQNFFRELKGTFKDFFLKIYLKKIFAPPIFVTQIFAPPIFMTSLRPCTGHARLLHRSPIGTSITAEAEPDASPVNRQYLFRAMTTPGRMT